MTKDWIVTQDKYLSEEELKKLREITEAEALRAKKRGVLGPVRDWMIIHVALCSGLRASELRELRVGDLILARGKNAITVRRGKRGKAREVAIPPELKEHLLEFLEWKRGVDQGVGPKDPLFVSERRDKLKLRGIQERFKVCARRAGLSPRYSIHSCRHTFATMLYKKTKDLRLVQKELGHSSIVTSQVYADVVDKQEGVNGLYGWQSRAEA